ncbi:MAG: site-specific DNA-methyltransferase [Desulfobacteraceae bacterium]|nr:site-specific DNA-methyltransferase [Desulfobacteraceae bacterium]
MRTRFIRVLAESGITDFSPHVETWTSTATNKALSYSSHGIFRYFGKFPPPIARYLINTYTDPNDLTIDPMCGSGTTGLEALLLDRRALCLEINPLSLLISKVKVTKLDKEEYLFHFDKIFERIKIGKKEAPYDLPGLKDPDHWFLPETRVSLSNIRRAIERSDAPKNIKNAFLVAFLSIIRRVSRATSQQGRLFLDVKTAETDASNYFVRKAQDIIEPLCSLPDANNRIEVRAQSILDPRIENTENVKLNICHPPYFNAYRYSRVNSLELAWLGINNAEIRKLEVREAFKVGKAENVIHYVDDLEKGLNNISQSILKNGRLALMIGDTIIKSQYVPTTKMVLERTSHIFEVESSALRIPQFTEASWASSQRRNGNQIGVNICDFVIILRKL